MSRYQRPPVSLLTHHLLKIMSLAIDSRYITGIYALGQWFKVKKGTVGIDAFEFTDWEEHEPRAGNIYEHRYTDYMIGDLYQDTDGSSGRYAQEGTSHGYFTSPKGCHGIAFTDADTGERVSFSLVEVRAFREVLS
jgi:hypothetical protein